VTSRRVAITGAASGLGAATRARFETEGAVVVGIDLAGSDVDADLSAAPGRRLAVDAVGRVHDALDVLVCCAGLGPQAADPARILAVNHFGAVEVLDGLSDRLAAGTDPAAVLISSNSVMLDPTIDADLVDACTRGDEADARRLAARLSGSTVYASSKQALARAMRRRAAPLAALGVRVNAVAPGAFDSPLLQGGLDDPVLGPLIEALPIPLGRRGRADEIADVVAWLCGTGARYVHGSVLVVDGGTDARLFPDRVP